MKNVNVKNVKLFYVNSIVKKSEKLERKRKRKKINYFTLTKT